MFLFLGDFPDQFVQVLLRCDITWPDTTIITTCPTESGRSVCLRYDLATFRRVMSAGCSFKNFLTPSGDVDCCAYKEGSEYVVQEPLVPN